MKLGRIKTRLNEDPQNESFSSGNVTITPTKNTVIVDAISGAVTIQNLDATGLTAGFIVYLFQKSPINYSLTVENNTNINLLSATNYLFTDTDRFISLVWDGTYWREENKTTIGGSQGSQGVQGASGPSGANGPQGSQGAIGEGSGPSGDSGDVGDANATPGPQGGNGPQGSQGPQGDMGNQGNNWS